ncbi:hypothetical protein [Comamonas antarctica]|uniref:hypothetical protein n=1 Tax=Comamonas antarctica TaxID=2743470 RepID=UPI0028F027F6|nr:hypothetical protein [Comamonas antarctica]
MARESQLPTTAVGTIWVDDEGVNDIELSPFVQLPAGEHKLYLHPTPAADAQEHATQLAGGLPTMAEIDDLVYALRRAGTDTTYDVVAAVLKRWGAAPALEAPAAPVRQLRARIDPDTGSIVGYFSDDQPMAAGVESGFDMRDQLVAISAAVAEQDAAKAQALLRDAIRAALAAAPQASDAPSTHAGILAAAAHIQAKASAYAEECGSYDPDTGAFEMRDAVQDHYNTLDELAEELRAMAETAAPAAPAVDALEDARDAARYRRIRNGPHSDRYGDLYAMTFQGDGDLSVTGDELDRVVDAAIAAQAKGGEA